MKRTRLKLAGVAVIGAGMTVLASCTEQKPPPTAAAPRVQSSVTTQPGVAGRTQEDVFIAQAIVSAIDAPTRRVTLTGPENRQFTFNAGPEIKNFDQIHVGDKVTATFARRLTIVVRSEDAPPSASLAAARATALKGDKPGLLVAEEAEVVASVKSIDPVSRTAVLEFSDGELRTVPVRPDVDLTRYKVGDTVVTRVTTALTVLVETP